MSVLFLHYAAMRRLDWHHRHKYYNSLRVTTRLGMDGFFSPDELLTGVSLHEPAPDVVALPDRPLRQPMLEEFGFVRRVRRVRQLSLADVGFVRRVRARVD